MENNKHHNNDSDTDDDDHGRRRPSPPDDGFPAQVGSLKRERVDDFPPEVQGLEEERSDGDDDGHPRGHEAQLELRHLHAHGYAPVFWHGKREYLLLAHCRMALVWFAWSAAYPHEPPTVEAVESFLFFFGWEIDVGYLVVETVNLPAHRAKCIYSCPTFAIWRRLGYSFPVEGGDVSMVHLGNFELQHEVVTNIIGLINRFMRLRRRRH